MSSSFITMPDDDGDDNDGNDDNNNDNVIQQHNEEEDDDESSNDDDDESEKELHLDVQPRLLEELITNDDTSHNLIMQDKRINTPTDKVNDDSNDGGKATSESDISTTNDETSNLPDQENNDEESDSNARKTTIDNSIRDSDESITNNVAFSSDAVSLPHDMMQDDIEGVTSTELKDKSCPEAENADEETHKIDEVVDENASDGIDSYDHNRASDSIPSRDLIDHEAIHNDPKEEIGVSSKIKESSSSSNDNDNDDDDNNNYSSKEDSGDEKEVDDNLAIDAPPHTFIHAELKKKYPEEEIDVEGNDELSEDGKGKARSNEDLSDSDDNDDTSISSDVETEIQASSSEECEVSAPDEKSPPSATEESLAVAAADAMTKLEGDDAPTEESQDRTSGEEATTTSAPKENKMEISEDPWGATLSEQDEADPAPEAPSIPISDTKGAKILMSRFSSWRKKANEAVTQNVSAFSKSEIGQQIKSRANAAYAATKIPPPATSKDVSDAAGKSKEQLQGQDAHVDVGEHAHGDADANAPHANANAPHPGAPHPDAPQPDAPQPEDQQQPETDSSVADDEDDDDDVAKSQETDGARNVPNSPEAVDGNTDDDATPTDVGAGANESASEDGSESDSTGHSESVSEAPNLRAATAALYVRTAASVVADSVATGFRGRYGDDGGPPASPSKAAATPKESQTAKIMGSRAAQHMQSILDTLDESHEYVMLLGHGMLGVNLRQTYLKNHGIYVDFLVEGGAASNSSVVYTGDVIQKVGNESVARGTILNVPKLIASSKRPAILVFSTGQKVELSNMVNYIDLAIAMMHQIKEEEESSGTMARMPFNSSLTKAQDDTDEAHTDEGQTDITSNIHEREIPPHPLDAINPANVPPPPMAAKEALKAHLAKRGNGIFSLRMMTHAAAKSDMDNFRTALHHAFVTCALDGRRLPFLSRHFATINSMSDEDERKDVGDVQKTNASVELMLFLELTGFVELYGATPKSRRRDIAKRIAFKFFLPSKIGKRLEKPMFDFSHIVEREELVVLRNLLVEPGGQDMPPPIQRNAFLSFQTAVIEKLCGAPFISFLMSDECARMRGYLRNTSPYRTVSPGDFFYHMAARKHDDHAANHLLYNLTFLLCQREREMCGENDDIAGEKTARVMGAAGGLCCAMFIKKTLLKIIQTAEDSLDNDVPLDSSVFQDLKRTYEQFWEMFASPHGGALEVLSSSNETADELTTVRKRLDAAIAEKDPEKRLELLTNVEMSHPLAHLADNLVYDYSVNAYTKFREHPFHEWMCAEVNRAPHDETHDFNNRIPKLTRGSIARLLRRAELPNGVSPHKPSRGSEEAEKGEKSIDQAKTVPPSIPSARITASYPNAHHAIVFGSNDGSDPGDRGANPALSQFDIRRYTCQEVWLNDENCEPPSKLCRVQPNIESYSIVPALRKSPFSGITDAGRVSADGWQVSLIDFMIPGAEAESSQNGATYGVSLVFQQDEITFFNTNGSSRTTVAPLKLVYTEPEKQATLETPKATSVNVSASEAAADQTEPSSSPFAGGGIGALAAQAAAAKLEKAEKADDPFAGGGIAAMAAQAAAAKKKTGQTDTPFAGGGIAAMAAQAAAAKRKKKEQTDTPFAGGGIAAMAAQAASVKQEKKEEANNAFAGGGIAAMAAQAAAKRNREPQVKKESTGKEEIVYDTATGEEINVRAFASPLSVFSPEPQPGSPARGTSISRVLRVETNTPSFNRRLAGNSWIERVKKQRFSLPTRAPVSIGIVLVSSQNVIYAMRDTLSQLLSDFSKQSDDQTGDETRFSCKSLVELLGNFAYMDIEYESLRYILQPYLRFGSSPWLRQPLRLQAEEFGLECGERLIESLPLIPLALLYVTVFLEQKIVFSSSRRGMLMSAVTAITKLLHPFKWEHLVVPLVPSSLARDLLEYPAPFIIGLAAEDEGNLELLNSLPDDVTLVDLDVGRVILAPVIAYDDRYSSSDRHRATAPALRSQVLYLAQALGLVFGAQLRPQVWCGDGPLVTLSKKDQHGKAGSFDKLQDICRSFLTEVVAGMESCSYWIEEQRPADMPSLSTEVDRTVLFDEDRFFQIKNLRALRKYKPLFEDTPGVGELALSLGDFDLVLECFLRCQSMSTYISTRPKKSMAFS